MFMPPTDVVVVLGFYVPPTAKVIWRRDLGLKSHPKDWRSPGSNSRPLVYKVGSLTARPQRFFAPNRCEPSIEAFNFFLRGGGGGWGFRADVKGEVKFL